MLNRRSTYILFVLLFLFLLSSTAQAQGQQNSKAKTVTRILFVFDASQSMYGRWQSDIKINIARKIMSKVLDSLQNYENLELALRVYGHQKHYPPQDCDDTRLEVPFGKDNFEMIKHRLNSLTPKGTTPIAHSLQKAGRDFPPCDNCRNIIILITDGIEECGGDPCEVSKELQRLGIILKPFVIGIGRNFRDAFDCVGTYFDASSEKQFSK
ncbi:MAG: VWA domain-containing protein, partial [Bacteroidales bacterium]|nr:VWA domain-containing protein [Bacteroidales bacterium]